METYFEYSWKSILPKNPLIANLLNQSNLYPANFMAIAFVLFSVHRASLKTFITTRLQASAVAIASKNITSPNPTVETFGRFGPSQTNFSNTKKVPIGRT